MSTRKLQTSKEWNENSPYLVYHHVVLAWINVLCFETVPAVFTLLTILVCYTCHHFAMNKLWYKAYPTAKVKFAKCHYYSNPPNILPAKISGYMVCDKISMYLMTQDCSMQLQHAHCLHTHNMDMITHSMTTCKLLFPLLPTSVLTHVHHLQVC